MTCKKCGHEKKFTTLPSSKGTQSISDPVTYSFVNGAITVPLENRLGSGNTITGSITLAPICDCRCHNLQTTFT